MKFKLRVLVQILQVFLGGGRGCVYIEAPTTFNDKSFFGAILGPEQNCNEKKT